MANGTAIGRARAAIIRTLLGETNAIVVKSPNRVEAEATAAVLVIL